MVPVNKQALYIRSGELMEDRFVCSFLFSLYFSCSLLSFLCCALFVHCLLLPSSTGTEKRDDPKEPTNDRAGQSKKPDRSVFNQTQRFDLKNYRKTKSRVPEIPISRTTKMTTKQHVFFVLGTERAPLPIPSSFPEKTRDKRLDRGHEVKKTNDRNKQTTNNIHIQTPAMYRLEKAQPFSFLDALTPLLLWGNMSLQNETKL